MDIALLAFVFNESKATRLQLQSMGWVAFCAYLHKFRCICLKSSLMIPVVCFCPSYAQSRTLQVTFRFFLGLSVSMLVALIICGSMYAFFLPTLHFWRFFYHETDVAHNISTYTPLYILGATGGSSVGNSTVVRYD